jgi:sulfatase modifying factor 1
LGRFGTDLAGFVKDCLRDARFLVGRQLRSSSGSCSKGITTILLPLLISLNQKHQPVKTSLRKRSFRALGLAAAIALSTPAFAVLTMDYVSVGHAGNAADSTSYGAVAYAYQIGKYEVTNAQYAEFLNAVDGSGANANGIYNADMGSVRGGITYTLGAASGAKYTIKSNMGDKPVNYVSWHDAARFTNWMHNGQGSGSTETGAYTLSGITGLITKNVGANVWLPSENEWYKAAYYDPTTGPGDNYWLYATQSDSAPTVGTANSTGVISNPGANVANFNNGADWNNQNGNVTTVGSAGAAANSYFGTADQAGNVSEWNDAVIDSSRGLRGGSWRGTSSLLAASWVNNSRTPAGEDSDVGFRVASVPVPEPGTLLPAAALVMGALLRRRRRRDRRSGGAAA